MRILTWNARGDTGNESGRKVDELKWIIDYWVGKGDEVAIVCLQEVNGQSGALAKYLQSLGWSVLWGREQMDDRGDYHVIAAAPGLTVQGLGRVDLSGYEDPATPASRKSRAPFCADITLPGGSQVTVFTWHATLGSHQTEDLEGFSQHIAGLLHAAPKRKLIVAGDLNCFEEVLDDGDLFSGSLRVSNRLDHILTFGIDLSGGICSDQSLSDHLPLSAHLVE